MKRLLLLAGVLLLSPGSVAGAAVEVDEPEQSVAWKGGRIYAGPGVDIIEKRRSTDGELFYEAVARNQETPNEDTDRFLAEKVQPEVEAGDALLDSADKRGKFSAPNAKMATSQNAIAHYLKALVLLEAEKLRRMRE